MDETTETPQRSHQCAVVALSVFLAAFLACVLAQAYGWHSAVTARAAAVLVVPLIACAVWLNMTAGSDDGEEEGPE